MKYKSLSFKESYELVKHKRKIIRPNSGFIGELQKYEELLKQKDSWFYIDHKSKTYISAYSVFVFISFDFSGHFFAWEISSIKFEIVSTSSTFISEYRSDRLSLSSALGSVWTGYSFYSYFFRSNTMNFFHKLN